MASRVRAVLRVAAATVVMLAVSRSAVASDPVYDVSGLQDGRAYNNWLPFESIDTITGNLILSFTDLVLPGNAGFDLKIVRTYNSRDGKWRLGLGGAPLSLQYNPPDYNHYSFDLVDVDGSRTKVDWAPHWIDTVDLPNLWRFTKSAFGLQMPNGVTAVYGYNVNYVGRYLTELSDPFGNVIRLSWQTNTKNQAVLASITQELGPNHTRTVTFSGWLNDTAQSFSYSGKSWAYSWDTTADDPPVRLLKTFTLPVGTKWTFTYHPKAEGEEIKKLARLKTVNGGYVSYTWGIAAFPTSPAERRVLKTRSTSGGVPAGLWTFDWQDTGARLVVTGPANRVTYENELVYGRPFAKRMIVSTVAGDELLLRTIVYNDHYGIFGWEPVVGRVTITRGTATYTTVYNFPYGGYALPSQIEEYGELTRFTELTYRSDFSRYILGRLATATVTAGGKSTTRTTTYDDATGFRLSEEANGLTTTFAADPHGNVASITDPAGRTSLFTYEWGVLKSSESPAHRTMTRTINPNGTVATQTAGGVTSSFSYDAIARATSSSQTGRPETTATYEAAGGSWTKTTGLRGGVTVMAELDGFGREIHTISSSGEERRTQYDAAGQRVYVSKPFGAGVADSGESFTYDALGRLVTVTRPDASLTMIDYPDSGRSVRTSNQLGSGWRVTTQVFQAFGDPADARMTSLTDEAGVTWTYEYDGAGHLTAVDSAAPGFVGSQRRTWQYDSRGFLAGEFNPENGQTTYVRDNAGQIISETSAGANAISYLYDPDGYLVVADAAGTADDQSATYDALGRLISQSSADVQTTFTYDAAGRLVTQTDTFAGRSFTQKYWYDSNDRITAMTYPISGRTVFYSYDPQGQLTSVSTQVPGGLPQPVLSNLTHRPFAAVSSFRFGNGLSQTVTFDELSRPSRWTSGPLDITYTYDQASNVTAIADARPGLSSTFAYDSLDRLISVSGYNAMAFTYDPAGNRTATSASTFSYNSSNQLTSVAGSYSGSLTYGARGNLMTTSDGVSFTYNAHNLPRTMTISGGTFTYTYGASGMRHVKTDPNGGQRYYIYGGGNQIIGEYQPVRATTIAVREFVYVGHLPVASFAGGGATYYHTDSVGSIRALTDQAGATVVRHDYWAFGGDVQPMTGDPLRFAGLYLDSESAFHYAEARYYRQIYGRFGAVDPLGGSLLDPQSWNKYAYARNNPLRYRDPSGRQFKGGNSCPDGGNGTSECPTPSNNSCEVIAGDYVAITDPGGFVRLVRISDLSDEYKMMCGFTTGDGNIGGGSGSPDGGGGGDTLPTTPDQSGSNSPSGTKTPPDDPEAPGPGATSPDAAPCESMCQMAAQVAAKAGPITGAALPQFVGLGITGGAAAAAASIWRPAAASIWRNTNFEFGNRNGRSPGMLFQVRYNREPVFRVEYHAINSLGEEPVLHFHIGLTKQQMEWHYPVFPLGGRTR